MFVQYSEKNIFNLVLKFYLFFVIFYYDHIICIPYPNIVRLESWCSDSLAMWDYIGRFGG